MPEGSPLRVHTERQAKLLKGVLGERGHHLTVTSAMRYGSPSMARASSPTSRTGGASRILLVPMYPHYSASTTATVVDEASQAGSCRLRNQPEIRYVRNFHDDEAYLAALEKSVRQALAGRTVQPSDGDRLLISFHGLPRRSLDLGDPYFCECHKTGRLLRRAPQTHGRSIPDLLSVTLRQGRVAAALHRTDTLEGMGQAKAVRRVDVICPGFVADCLETLEEIAQEGRDDFIESRRQGIPLHPGALNEDDAWIKALADIAEQHLGGWETKTAFDPHALETSAREAFKFGAKT